MYSDIARKFLRDHEQRGREGDIYERFYYYLLNNGFTREEAESEVADFMETVANLMD